MKAEHRKYILTHYKKKTVEQIARDLQLKERTVERFLAKQQEKYQEQQKKEAVTEKRRNPLNVWLLLAVALLGFIFYSNAMKGEFVWDDNILVRNNTDIRDWGNLNKVFFGNLGGETLYYKHSSYRPIQTLSYMIDFSLWKMDPMGYHLTSVICHLLVAVCLYIFIFKIFPNNFIAFATSLMYVLHPMHTEAVTYISGRADPLSTMFMLLSLIFYLRLLERESFVNYIMMGLCYVLGVLSRENALMVPAFVFVYHLTLKKKIQWRPIIVYACIAGFYIFLRVNEIVGGLGLKEPVKTSIFERMPGFFVAYASYLRIMIAPFNLHMEYLRPLFSMSKPLAILGMLFFAGTMALATFFHKRIMVVTFGIMWFLVGLFPVSNVFVVVNAYMAEHWLYIPSIGVFLMAAYGMNHLAEKNDNLKYTMYGLLAVVSLFFGILTYEQNKTWLNQVEFYERTLKFAPNSGRLHADMGEAYYRVGRVEDALKSTIRAIQLRPTYYAAYSNLGTIYVRLGQPDKAIEAYKNSLKIRPNYFNAHFNLANVYKDQNRCEEAVVHYQQAIHYMPSLSNAYNNIAICYSQLGQKEEAAKYYQAGITINPKNVKFYNNLASVLSDLGRHQEAVDLYLKALSLGSSDEDQAIIYYNLSLGYFRTKRPQEAGEAFNKANSYQLKNPRMYQQLAMIYMRSGLKKQADYLMNRARQAQSGL